ncbi:hypothetical protein GLYMA_06G240900v4 [Glycine max]|nr:hypothetical protein GLYMA_06G240900v4 [Glycine max]KAH1127388.1 hypothetical protein GYH30_016110 [Glycine max]
MSSCFGYCNYYHDLRSNKMNVFCVDYALRMCRHCKEAHSLHRRFQIYKYSYPGVFRHAELQKYFDCSKIQKGVGDKALNQLEKSISSKLEAIVARQISKLFRLAASDSKAGGVTNKKATKIEEKKKI